MCLLINIFFSVFYESFNEMFVITKHYTEAFLLVKENTDMVVSQQTFVGLEYVFETYSVQQFFVSQDVLKTSWKTKNCYTVDVFTMSWRHVFKTSWRHVLKMSWRQTWRRYREKQNVQKSIFQKSMSDKFKTNPIISILVLFLNSSNIFILRIKVPEKCLVMFIKLNLNSTLQNSWGNINGFLSNVLHKYI